MGLQVAIETRTGDTPVHKRQRQKLKPPDILLTTPEQVALLLSATDAPRFFADLDTVILDELHALVTSKRGDLLALGLARLRALAPRPQGDRAVGDRRRARRAAGVAGRAGRRSAPRSRDGDRLLQGRTASASPVQGEEHGGHGAISPATRGSQPSALALATSPSQSGWGGAAGRRATEAAPHPASPRGAAPAPPCATVRGPTGGDGVASRAAEAARCADIVVVEGGAKPDISHPRFGGADPVVGAFVAIRRPRHLRDRQARTGWRCSSSMSARQAELIFQELWRINVDGLPIALHHGSLDAGQRRKVETAMAAGKLRAVVCTSTLDLGIDWGDVDLVVNIGAPKGASRLAQRIGRANHRLDEPSKAVLVPANRFEVIECRVALDANYLGAQDTPPIQPGALDVLAQHVLGMACSAPFDADALYAEVTSAYPYRDLDRATFDRVVDFVATGGYALRSYERFAKIRRGADGLWRITHPAGGAAIPAQCRHHHRGAAPQRAGRAERGAGFAGRGGRVARQDRGELHRGAGAGRHLPLRRADPPLRGDARERGDRDPHRRRHAEDPDLCRRQVPDHLVPRRRRRGMLADPKTWSRLPPQVSEWLAIQKRRSLLPKRDQLLVETFPRGNRTYMVAYPFEGRLAHQTLGMLLTRRLERARLRPAGFVASDYSLAIWALGDLGRAFQRGEPSLAELFAEDMLGDDLEAWMAESYLLKRMFRNTALISGLIEKRHPGREKSGRQVTVSTDLIYDVLRRHEPDHILLQATWADAATGLLEVARVGDMLSRVKGRIVHKRLDRISPLAVPAMLQIGREVGRRANRARRCCARRRRTWSGKRWAMMRL